MARWLTFGVLLLASSPVAAWAEDIKVGVVDRQRAISETDEGKRAVEGLKKVFDQKQKELSEQEAAFKKDRDDLEKKRTLLPADKQREKDMELQARAEKLQQTLMRHQQDLQNREQEALSKIAERMDRVIKNIGSDQNFTIILDKAVVHYAKPQLDVTNEVIRRCNAAEVAEKGGAGKAAAAAKPAAAGATAAAKK